MYLLSSLTNKDSYNTQIVQCVNDPTCIKRFRIPGLYPVLEPVLELNEKTNQKTQNDEITAGYHNR